MRKYIQNNGGMHEFYKDFITIAQSYGFKLYEVTKDSFYLHYGTMEGKIGIQFIQLSINKVGIIFGEETPMKQVNNLKWEVTLPFDAHLYFNDLISELKYVNILNRAF
ncbi:MAG: hypothetical protein ABIJ97_09360 [Bacteroidota bacterium]